MKTTQIIAAAVLSLAAASTFAAQGEIKAPADSATRAIKYQHGSNATTTSLQGKTRAEVRAQLKDNATEFSNRNTQR